MPLYIDAMLTGNVITCPYTESYLRYFQSEGNFTAALNLSINEEIILNVTQNLSFIEPP